MYCRGNSGNSVPLVMTISIYINVIYYHENMNHNLIIFPWINCVGFSLFEFINAFGDINGISDARIYFRNIPIEKIKQNQQYQFSCLFKATLSKYMITNSHDYSTIDHFSPNHFSIKFNLQYIKKLLKNKNDVFDRYRSELCCR